MSPLLRRVPRALPLGFFLALSGASPALAGSFDPSGAYSHDPAAVASDDFEAYPGDPAGASGSSGESGGSGESGSSGESGGSGESGSSGESGGSGESGSSGQGGEGGESGSSGQAGAAGEGGEAGAGGESGGSGQGGEAGAGGAPGPVYPYKLVEDPTALTGQRVLTLGPWESAGIGFSLPAEDGSYVARIWVKGETVATVEVRYADGSAPATSQLFPTGRVTSDGWAELESAPFSVEAARGPDAAIGFFSPAGVTADAFEVVRGGEFRPVRSCTGVNDTTSCLPDEMCLYRACVDGRGLVPPMPADPQDRKDLADYMGNRIQFLFGPLLNREMFLEGAMAAVEQMRSAEDRYRFWFSFVTAIQRLRDSHSTAFGFFQFQLQDFPGRIPLNACFVTGDADLSHDQVPRDKTLPDVLVSHTGEGATWGLRAGDRLVAIDGEHPILWAQKLEGRSWSAEQVNDPLSFAQHVESLRGKITSLARTLTVIRCNGGLQCGAPEMLKVADQPAEEATFRVNCDNRPLNHFPDQPPDHGIGGDVFHGPVSGSTPEERIHGMAWDSLYGAGSSTGIQIEDAVISFRAAKARGVILDHRTGNGGTKDAAMPILSFVTPPKYAEVDVWRTYLDEVGPQSKAEGLALFDQVKDEPLSLGYVGSEDAAVDVPVALLLTRDVSASDYFPNAFKGSPRTRIFGPNPTNGAFSTFLGYSYWLGLSFQLAAQDTINHDGTMLCARGVVPDEIVEPRQSDLVQGIDTVYEAALAWVRANLKQESP